LEGTHLRLKPPPTNRSISAHLIGRSGRSPRSIIADRNAQVRAALPADPVAPGTEIAVSNVDGAQHTLTADDGSFNTGGLDGGATIAITAPDVPGTYSFVCNIHPSMTGSLTVDG
jgi:plastocyanin